MIKQYTHKQVTPESTWTVTIPQNGTRARPIAAYTPAGNSINWDSWIYRDGQLIIDFGIDTQFGELDYEYNDGGTSSEGSTCEGKISININQKSKDLDINVNESNVTPN